MKQPLPSEMSQGAANLDHRRLCSADRTIVELYTRSHISTVHGDPGFQQLCHWAGMRGVQGKWEQL